MAPETPLPWLDLNLFRGLTPYRFGGALRLFGSAALLMRPGVAAPAPGERGTPFNRQWHTRFHVDTARIDPPEFLETYLTAWQFPPCGWPILVVRVEGAVTLEECRPVVAGALDTRDLEFSRLLCLFPDGGGIEGTPPTTEGPVWTHVLSKNEVAQKYDYADRPNTHGKGIFYAEIAFHGDRPPPLAGRISYRSRNFGGPLDFTVGGHQKDGKTVAVSRGEIARALRPLLLASPEFLDGISETDLARGLGALCAAAKDRTYDLLGRAQPELLRRTLGYRPERTLRRIGTAFVVWRYQQGHGPGPYPYPPGTRVRTFGRLLSDLMEERGFSSTQVADLLQTDLNRIRRLLTGKETVPYEIVVRLLNLFSLRDPARLAWSARRRELQQGIEPKSEERPVLDLPWHPLGGEGLFIGLSRLIMAHRVAADLSRRQLADRAAARGRGRSHSAKNLMHIERGQVRPTADNLLWLCRVLGIPRARAFLERDGGMILSFIPAAGAAAARVPPPMNYPYTAPAALSPPRLRFMTFVSQTEEDTPKPPPKGTLGHTVRLVRLYRGFSGRTLAANSELTPDNVSKIEHNREKPDLLTLECLSDERSLGISIVTLARAADATTYPHFPAAFPVGRFNDPTLPPIYQGESPEPARLEFYWRWQRRHRFLSLGALVFFARKDLRRLDEHPLLNLTMEEDARTLGIHERDWLKYEMAEEVPGEARVRKMARFYGADEETWVASATRTRKVLKNGE